MYIHINSETEVEVCHFHVVIFQFSSSELYDLCGLVETSILKKCFLEKTICLMAMNVSIKERIKILFLEQVKTWALDNFEMCTNIML